MPIRVRGFCWWLGTRPLWSAWVRNFNTWIRQAKAYGIASLTIAWILYTNVDAHWQSSSVMANMDLWLTPKQNTHMQKDNIAEYTRQALFSSTIHIMPTSYQKLMSTWFLWSRHQTKNLVFTDDLWPISCFMCLHRRSKRIRELQSRLVQTQCWCRHHTNVIMSLLPPRKAPKTLSLKWLTHDHEQHECALISWQIVSHQTLTWNNTVTCQWSQCKIKEQLSVDAHGLSSFLDVTASSDI